LPLRPLGATTEGIVFFRKHQHTREITEAMAYQRCHGDRGSDILRVTRQPPYELPQRRRGFGVSVAGETLRQAFAARLDRREAGGG
jgi:hypothetical protein